MVRFTPMTPSTSGLRPIGSEMVAAGHITEPFRPDPGPCPLCGTSSSLCKGHPMPPKKKTTPKPQGGAQAPQTAPVDPKPTDPPETPDNGPEAAPTPPGDNPEVPSGDPQGENVNVTVPEPLVPSDTDALVTTSDVVEESKTTVPERGVPAGRILEVGEDVVFDGQVVGNMVIVQEDVYRKVYPFRSLRPTYVLIYNKGTQIASSSLRAVSDNQFGA